MIAFLASPIARWVGIALACAVAAGTLYAFGRDAGTDKALIDAAQAEQETRRAGNAAAADAERDGAAVRLRDGSF